MSGVNGFMRDVIDGVRKRASDRLGDEFDDGFEEAANICMGVISKNVDGLLHRIKSGNYLSDQEQFLLSKLTEMQSETEKSLREFQGSSTIDEGR